MQRIRDPLHDLIQFNMRDELERMLWEVAQTFPFQRLRRIKQLGFSDLVYPGATHSRYAHSLGVYHTAHQLLDRIERQMSDRSHSKRMQSLAAALLHDLGHGAFSHAFEKVGKKLKLEMANHELVSDALIRDSEVTPILNRLGKGFAEDVADIIQGIGEKTIYNAVVSSQFDADRLDYMRRDRLMSGTQHSAIDFEWLLANLEIGTVSTGVDDKKIGHVDTIVLGPKAVHAAEAYVLGLFQLYPTVYLHKATRGAELLFVELISRVVTLCQNGESKFTGLPNLHPLVKFAKKPADLERALELDDTVIWGALPMLKEAKDKVIAEFAERLQARKLFKCVDVQVELSKSINPKGSDDAANLKSIDVASARVILAIEEWNGRYSSDTKRILIDQYSRTPYKSVEDTDGPLDQIHIKTASGELVDLKKRSKVVDALTPFKIVRAYVADNDDDARNALKKIIEEACNEKQAS
ncbi:hypothetical protein CN878_10020 [Ochrobactrum sp. 695/2009]|nr:hypothetical protein CN881_17470 [Ochrobactrum sp. 721/2009]PJT15822.1 hypothetical protein CN880_05260 [Ochrobactrum sp. 720/2009]PJT25642.1 hypothetical protein CN879_01225 [Ochrobactrum sp. 715/2009]PJT29248.1 hypothetical protein CN878_10020 [Ochrobactrum sp. 695/2009]PJT35164.1 hypothetical protein CN877_03675 [Ochrobactrum sp. 689/2009]